MHRPLRPFLVCLLISSALAVAAHQPAQRLPADILPQVELTEIVLSDILTAEIARQRGQYGIAYKKFMSAARTSRRSQLAERAWQCAVHTKNERGMRDSLLLWNELDPLNEQASMLKTVENMVQSQWETARTGLQRLLKKSKTPGKLFVDVATLAASTQPIDKARALSVLIPISSPFAGSPEVNLSLSKLAAQAQDKNNALAYALKAVQLAPDDDKLLLESADVTFGLDPAFTARMLESYLNKHPKSVSVLLAQAKTHVRTVSVGTLSHELSVIEALAPDSLSTLFALGMIAEEVKLYSTAERYYLQVLELAKNSDEGRYNIDAFFIRLGMVKVAQRRPDEAIDWFDKVQKGDKYIPAKLRQVELLASRKRLDESCSVLRAIHTEDIDKKISFREACAELMTNAKRMNEAADAMLEALALRPNDTQLLYRAALSAEEANRLPEAETLLRKVMRLEPINPQAPNALGYMLTNRGVRLAEAEQLIQSALRLSKNQDGFILDSLGWLRYRQGNLAEAERLLKQAFDKQTDTEIGLHLAQVLFARGKLKEAEQLARSLLKADPNNRDVRDLLQINGIKL